MMGFGNMMGSTSPFWAVLVPTLGITLVLGMITTIIGIVKYSENKKDKQLITWGIIILFVPIVLWGIMMSVGSNYFDSNHNDEEFNMMDY